MTVCKACGSEITLAYLEKHICPTPNPDYEKERDRYRQAVVESPAGNERLGITEVPSPPVWRNESLWVQSRGTDSGNSPMKPWHEPRRSLLPPNPLV